MLDFINDDYVTISITNIWDLNTTLPKWIIAITDLITDYYQLDKSSMHWDKMDFFFSESEAGDVGRELFQEFLRKNNISFEEYSIISNNYPREERARGYVFKVTPELTDLMLKYS